MRRSTFTLSKLFILVAIIGVLIFCTSSCNNMPNNGVPIYLQIDSARVSLAPGSPYGSASSNIPGTWVTTGSHNLGAYEMPVNIPVLASGSVPLAISAGIYDNGIVNQPLEYPFYSPDTLTIYNAIPGRVYHIKPVYGYYSYVQVALNETFDADNQFSNVTPLTNRNDSDVYEGLRSGGIILSSQADSLTAIQNSSEVISTTSNQAFVELNYKLPNPNVQLDVGVIATLYNGAGTEVEQNTFDLLVLTAPIGIWNKVYIDFSTPIGDNPGYTFQLYFTGYHQQGQQDTVFMDNIKLLYH